MAQMRASFSAEARGEILLFRHERFARYAVELGNAVVFLRMLLTRRIAAALLGHNVQQDGFFHLFRQREELAHALEVVAVHRAEIGEAHLLEQRGRQHDAFHLCLEPRQCPRDARTAGYTPQPLFHAGLGAEIARADAQARQMPAQSADIPCDGHIIVVEHNEQRLARSPGAVQRLVGHAAGQRAVTDDCDNVVFLVLERAGVRHAERYRNRIRGVARDARVGDALLRLHEAAQAAVLAQRVEAVAPPGQNLVDIALVADIVDDAVARGVKFALECHSQLHDAQIGGQMAAGLRHRIHDELAQRRAQHAQRVIRQPAQVGRTGYVV